MIRLLDDINTICMVIGLAGMVLLVGAGLWNMGGLGYSISDMYAYIFKTTWRRILFIVWALAFSIGIIGTVAIPYSFRKEIKQLSANYSTEHYKLYINDTQVKDPEPILASLQHIRMYGKRPKQLQPFYNRYVILKIATATQTVTLTCFRYPFDTTTWCINSNRYHYTSNNPLGQITSTELNRYALRNTDN